MRCLATPCELWCHTAIISATEQEGPTQSAAMPYQEVKAMTALSTVDSLVRN